MSFSSRTSIVPVILQLLLLLLLVLVSSSARLGSNNNDEAQQIPEEEQARQLQNNGLLISDQFIVQVSSLVKRNSILNALQEWMPPEAEIMYKYKHAITGFAVTGIAEAALQAFADSLNNPGDIVLIEPDYQVELYDDDAGYYEHEPNRQKEERKKRQQQNQATWGLDRIDQKNLPLDGTFNSPRKNGNDIDGSGVDAYIIDTGVLQSHDEFGGRVTLLKDFTNDADGIDYNGHGTHVAGTAAGQTYGVAPGANIVSVKVLDKTGSGSNSGVLAGIDWVAKKHKQKQQNGGAGLSVANLSLGSFFSLSTNQAVQALADAGVVVAVAAGNDSSSACLASPASALGAITVGSSTRDDTRSSFSNFGLCIDLFAPGSDITSAWIGSDTATRTISGTSMASPHAAGAAALLLQADPTTTGTQAANNLIDMAVKNKLSLDIAVLSPNRLLYTGKIGNDGNNNR